MSWNEWLRLTARLHAECPTGSVVELLRVFHRPTGLEPGLRVDLCVAAWPVSLDVALNAQPLGAVPPGSDGRWPIADRVLPTNRLSLVPGLAAATEARGEVEVGSVWLELVAGEPSGFQPRNPLCSVDS